MDIAVKYRIISKIINSEDESVLDTIKLLLKIEDETDFWDELSPEDHQAINEGLAQLDSRQYATRESVREDVKSRFKF